MGAMLPKPSPAPRRRAGGLRTKRAALYARRPRGGPNCALLPCAREARRLGLRVVAVAQDEPGDAQTLGGAGLVDLVRRMNWGEFEAIVADAAPGAPIILHPVQPNQGDFE